MMSILNKWFYEEISKIKEIDLTETHCMSIISISIHTLYLYDDKIKKRLSRIIEDYIRLSSKYQKDGRYLVDPLANFYVYLRTKSIRKDNEIIR